MLFRNKYTCSICVSKKRTTNIKFRVMVASGAGRFSHISHVLLRNNHSGSSKSILGTQMHFGKAKSTFLLLIIRPVYSLCNGYRPSRFISTPGMRFPRVSLCHVNLQHLSSHSSQHSLQCPCLSHQSLD